MAALLSLSVAAQPAIDTRGPPGTIGVASSDDFRTVILLAPGTGAVTRVRAPDKVFSLRIDLSPDGRRIASAGLNGIWVFSRSGAGAKPRQVVPARGSAFAPGWVTWAPNGREFVFTREEVLYTIAASGGTPAKLLGGRVYAPDWSPTGGFIVLVRNASPRTGAGTIQSVGPDGRDIRSIVRGGHPDVSPDGAMLAFSRRDGIYVMGLNQGAPRRVVRRGEHPEWSPDGRYLAFTRDTQCGDAGCAGRVFIVPVTGGRPRAIGPHLFEIGPLSWSR